MKSGAKPVVVGIEGSSTAIPAVRWAAAEANRRRTGLRIVFSDVFSLVYLPELPMVPLPDSYTRAVQRQSQQWMEQASEVATETAPGVAVETTIRTGSPGAVLIEESRAAQFVAVGSRGLVTGWLVNWPRHRADAPRAACLRALELAVAHALCSRMMMTGQDA